MRKAAALAALAFAAACGTGDNVVVGGAQESTLTTYVDFSVLNSVINGRVMLMDANGEPTGTEAEVVLISDRPNLCDRLTQTRDYFRNPQEINRTLILYLPPTDHLGTFLPGRPGDEGTGSEIVAADPAKRQACIDATGKPVAPFPVVNTGYISLRDWSESPGGESAGTFNLLYAPPPPLTSTNGFPFYGKFKATYCPTLNGTLLPVATP
jgi:hypothetical protein